MQILPFLRDRLADSALLPNLIAAAALAVAVQIPSWLLRRLLRNCGGKLTGLTGSESLGAAGQEAARRAEAVLFWLTVTAVVLISAGGVAYHIAGRDVRTDLGIVAGRLTVEDLVSAGFHLGGVLVLLAVLWLALRWLRRARPHLEKLICSQFGGLSQNQSGTCDSKVPAPIVGQAPGNPQERMELRRGLGLLEQFTAAGACLLIAWVAGRVLGLGTSCDKFAGLAARLLLILAGIRLLPLAARVLAGIAANLGDRHLGQGRFRRYWDRARRLFPFGQRCFEAAVYVYGAALAVRELGFLAGVADYGPRGVVCIGIFFGCRVAIELSQVLLHEAFGLSDENRPPDPKGQTLLPLLQSACQYCLYFGAGVMMLGVLGVNTAPILAGAGLVGLAVGLGAQSLVADVVSGFFILLEGQYLVGDQVEIGEARGRVEAFSIRNTQVRDAQGRLHLIPNGQIRSVVSSSKGYVNAVVDMRLAADSDLSALLEAMREAGRRLRQERGADVLAETEVQGLIELGPSDMTARAVTRVSPGTQGQLANDFRRLLKQVLDERQSAAPARQAA
jgi:small-conductance mechanosensitive channel